MLDVDRREGREADTQRVAGTWTVISRLMQSDAPLAACGRRSGQIRPAAVHRRISLEPATVGTAGLAAQEPPAAARSEMWR